MDESPDLSRNLLIAVVFTAIIGLIGFASYLH